MNKNKRILVIIFIFFLALMVYLSYDMASRTVKPWGKKNDVLKKYKTGK